MVSMGFPSSAFNLRRLVCISATVNEHLSSSSSSASSKSTLKKQQLHYSPTKSFLLNGTVIITSHTPLRCSLLMLNYSCPRMQFKDPLLPVKWPFTFGRISCQSHMIVGIFVWPVWLIKFTLNHPFPLHLVVHRQFIHRCEVWPNCTQLLFQGRSEGLMISWL